MNYYNEFDPFAAQWLRNLIDAGLIPQGDVDDRSIIDVRGDDLRGYEQCHFFAGIGGWAYALQLAGWEGECWTGSCPCQPFSVAGSGKGTADERHLWPAFRRLIEECGPPVVFGEQVASEAGRTWLTGVRADLEELGYACGAADLCTASVTAPHIRQRLYWVADAADIGHERRGGTRGRRSGSADNRADSGQYGFEPQDRGVSGLADAGHTGREHPPEQERGGEGHGPAGRVAHDNDDGPHRPHGTEAVPDSAVGAGSWANTTVILCGDGKYRRIPVEPALFPLVDGPSPGRVGILRGAGNAIVPPLAAEFIQAFMEVDSR